MEIPTYELTGESFELSGKWMVYTAKLTCRCNRDDLIKLIGTELLGKPIKAVESYAVQDQSYKWIGLAINIKGDKNGE